VVSGKIGVETVRLHGSGRATARSGADLSDAKAGLRRSAYDVVGSYGGFAAAAALDACAQAWDRHLHEMAAALDGVGADVQRAAAHYDQADGRVARATAGAMRHTSDTLDATAGGR
jgi:uncharacterized protein YukE